MAKYNLDRLRPLPTDKEARAESSAGFRPREASGASGSGKVGSSRKTVDTPKMARVHSVQVITAGLDADGDLRDKACPMGEKVEKARKYQLAVFKTQDDKDIVYDPTWKQTRIDKWFRQLLPLLFEFLDAQYPAEVVSSVHWILLGKAQRKLFVMDRDTISGVDVAEAIGSSKRPLQEHILRIATKHKIPFAQYKDLDAAVEKITDGQTLDSESEPEETAPVRRQSRMKGKSKAKPVQETSSSEESDSDGDLDLDELEEEDAVVNKYPGKTIKEEPRDDDDPFLNDSDLEVLEGPPLKHEGLSLKRSASPFGSFDPSGSNKRMRSGSYHSRRSLSDDETQGSMSPHLQPTTSSFQHDLASGSNLPLINIPSTSAAPLTSFVGAGLSSTSTPVTGSLSRRLTGHTVNRWVAPPPREGLSIPKTANNPWST
ncbi:hypothetical protein C8R46DRAFT_1028281 [Mycena filopes]|nr:hypothetical protein C8R46DRAFT_1028281 [Mycena filopes]